MIIRAEAASDYAAIREIHLAAFANQQYSVQNEHLIVDALRAAGALTVSLVAESETGLVGHIAFSPISIDGEDRGWFALGPVGVLPAMQRKGVGSELVREGLDRLRGLGAEGCVVLGEPAYYGRFGFRQRPELVLEGVPAEFFMCLPMSGEMAHGRVEHHAAFERD